MKFILFLSPLYIIRNQWEIFWYFLNIKLLNNPSWYGVSIHWWLICPNFYYDGWKQRTLSFFMCINRHSTTVKTFSFSVSPLHNLFVSMWTYGVFVLVLYSIIVIILFDTQAFPDLANGSPWGPILCPFNISSSIFDHFLVFWPNTLNLENTIDNW